MKHRWMEWSYPPRWLLKNWRDSPRYLLPAHQRCRLLHSRWWKKSMRRYLQKGKCLIDLKWHPIQWRWDLSGTRISRSSRLSRWGRVQRMVKRYPLWRWRFPSSNYRHTKITPKKKNCYCPRSMEHCKLILNTQRFVRWVILRWRECCSLKAALFHPKKDQKPYYTSRYSNCSFARNCWWSREADWLSFPRSPICCRVCTNRSRRRRHCPAYASIHKRCNRLLYFPFYRGNMESYCCREPIRHNHTCPHNFQ